MTTRGRQYPDGRLPDLEGWPDNSLSYWPEAAGEFLHNMLGGDPQPGPPYTHTIVPPEPAVLTSTDPEPPPGTIVRDDLGRDWILWDEDEGGGWLRTDADDDPESWTKIAGNYGPVTVLEWGEPEP